MDPHNLIAFEDYPFSNDDWLGEGYQSITNPSHEAYGGDGVIWSTVAVKKLEENVIGDIIHSRVGFVVDENKVFEYNFLKEIGI